MINPLIPSDEESNEAVTELTTIPPVLVDFVRGFPIPTLMNTLVALSHLPLEFREDVFRGKKSVGGRTGADGQIEDEAVTMIRAMIRLKFDFEPSKSKTWDAINLMCRKNAFHPVQDYLDEVMWKWDGVPRVEQMLTNYFKVANTPLARMMSKLVMVASVRRIFQPGTKYDLVIVLEAPEGYNKSKALRVLYGADYFSDQTLIGVSDKELQEHLRGRWCIELAELSGMKKADSDKVKSQITREIDRARPAYGRVVLEILRSTVMWGTTNESIYLRSQTGNRRWEPFKVLGEIDVAGLEADRNQLWAEAACMEAKWKGDLSLPKEFWDAARIEQDERTITDPWAETLREFTDDVLGYVQRHEATDLLGGPPSGEVVGGVARVRSTYVMGTVLNLPSDRAGMEHSKRLVDVMKRLGWDGPKTIRIGKTTANGYSRTVDQTDEGGAE